MLDRLKLDRGRYFSTVHYGEGGGHVAYKQDKLPFDGDGNLVESELTPELRKAAEEKAAKFKVVQQRDGSTVLEGGDQVNFEAWLKGEINYPPAKLFAALRETHNMTVNNFQDAVEFLVSDPTGPKVIPLSLVSPKRIRD